MGTLRFLLALSVLITHTTPILGIKLVGGTISVQSFFIISGFYMSLILDKKYVGSNASYKLFITNRLLRIYPLYWFILLLTTTLFLISKFNGNYGGILDLNLLKFKEGVLDFKTFLLLTLSNLIILGQDLISFLAIHLETKEIVYGNLSCKDCLPLWRFLFIPQAWTISIEILFYCISPFLLSKKNLILFLIFLTSLSIRILLITFDLDFDPWSERFFPTQLLFFLLGNISYKIYDRINTNDLSKIFLFFTSIIFIITLFFQFLPGKEILFYIYFTILVLTLPFLFHYSKKNQIDRYIGELSYPIYISHIFIVYIIETREYLWIESLGMTVFIISIIFSIFCYEIICRPIEKIRQKRLG